MLDRPFLWLAAVVVLLVPLAACAPAEEPAAPGDVTLTVEDPPSQIDGNVLEFEVTAENFEIVPADGDTSGDSGHLHVFIDRDPVGDGETIPVERDIVHSAESPVRIYGLSTGSHTFTVVLGDGAHTRIHPDAEQTFEVQVNGPSVRASAPPSVAEGEDVSIEISSEGVEIVPADGDDGSETGHFHVLVDPEEPPGAGEEIPPAEEGRIIHTTETQVTLTGLERGEHTIWIVLGDGTHTAFDPPVMDRIRVVVGAADDCEDLSDEDDMAEITETDFAFSPDCLIVTTAQGLSITNEGQVRHNFSLRGPDVDLDTEAGEFTNTEAIGGIAEPGTYEFFCKYHPNQMTGEIRIQTAGR